MTTRCRIAFAVGAMAAFFPGTVGGAQAYRELVVLGWIDWLQPAELAEAAVVALAIVAACLLGGLLAMGAVGCFERD
jgi:hypothetical protein